MNEHDAAMSRFGAMSGCVRSTPVSMSPTRAPAPWLTPYEPLGVAPIARMSHWQAPSGSGPTSGGTEKSDAQAACSVAIELTAARAVKREGAFAFPAPNRASRATPAIAPDLRRVRANEAFDDEAVAIPSLFTRSTVPPAVRIASTPRAECPVFRTTMYF